jgi:hypothetical protein
MLPCPRENLHERSSLTWATVFDLDAVFDAPGTEALVRRRRQRLKCLGGG